MANNGSVIVVDDSPESLQLIAATLSSEGYIVRPTDNGELALLSIEAQPPELVLLDIKMPGIDGFELCKKFKNNPKTERIPIIFLSAALEVEERVEGLKLGAVDFMLKPFQREELLARVRTHVELSRLRGRLEKLVEERTEELTKANTLLMENEERLNKSQEIAHIGSWDYDHASGKLTWSNETYRIFGYNTFDQKPNYNEFLQLIHPEDRATADAAFIESMSINKQHHENEYRIIRKDSGEIRHINNIYEHTKNNDGKTVRTVGLIQDLTGRKHTEEELINLEKQLIQTQKMEAIGKLAGGIAHDFNNMLAVILGYTDLLLPTVEQAKKTYNRILEIQKAAEKAKEMTQQLLAFSRKQSIEPKIIDLGEMLKDMEKTLGRLLGEDIIQKYNIDEKLWKINSDPTHINQILMNLAVNAKDAMPEGGTLTIVLSNAENKPDMALLDFSTRQDHFVMISVSDTGEGIRKEILPFIFDPFFTTKEEGKGTGLGLSTVYGIVRQNNGCISIETETSKGTTFKIYLPATVDASDLKKTGKKMPELKGDGSKTIVLVEDDDLTLRVTGELLLKLGYKVVPFNSPTESILFCENHNLKADLLLTDVIMPEINGKELSQKFKAKYPNIKVLYMSGYTEEIISRKGIHYDETMFIQKPFSSAELSQKIKKILISHQYQHQ